MSENCYLGKLSGKLCSDNDNYNDICNHGKGVLSVNKYEDDIGRKINKEICRYANDLVIAFVPFT